jgi:plasmid stabilization system protein ParE
LKEAAEKAAEHPFVGRKVPEFNLTQMRERLVGPYRLIYFVSGTWIEVISIVHGARELSEQSDD